MTGITGLGTTYNLPNYTGLLYQLSPTDTPFFSSIGGLSGGGQTTSTEFEWQTSDLRAADQTVALEGADAPTAQERVRANVSNVCEIHQSQVSVSYTKLAATGQKAGSNNEAVNPVRAELDWQTQQELLSMVRDVEYSFINGVYQKPTDNTTPRKTRGLLAAITTNAVNYGADVTGATATASSDVITSTGHGLVAGDQVIISAKTNGAGLTVGAVYFVISPTANAFSVSSSRGGPAVDITTDGTAITFRKLTTLTYDIVNNLLQLVYDNGGIMQADSAALMVPSHLKAAISKAYADAFGKYNEMSRTVGGVNMTTLITDFGTLNVMTNRYMPKGTLAVVSLEQCTPVYLEIPQKGHFFAEPLAKTGSAEKVQLYGEVGLAYGNQLAHGKATNLG